MSNPGVVRAAGIALLLCGAGAGAAAAQQCRTDRPAGAVIRGVVVDRETRVPLQGARVGVTWSQGQRERTYELNADSTGRFRVCQVPANERIELRAGFFGEGPRQEVRMAANDSVAVTLEVAAPHSVLRGRVVEQDGRGVLGDVAVTLLDTPAFATTDAAGEFSLAMVPPGRYRVQFSRVGFGVRTDTVSVDFRSTVDLVAELAPEAIRLAQLVVSVRSHILSEAGFYERQKAGHGAFLTRQDWAKQNPSLPTDAPRSVPGVKIGPGPNRMDTTVFDRRNCPMRYWMDGVRLNPTFQLDQIDVQWIEALEIYRGPAEVPGEFRSFGGSERGHCGVIVISTRRGGSGD